VTEIEWLLEHALIEDERALDGSVCEVQSAGDPRTP
jgi:hypothetical protein